MTILRLSQRPGMALSSDHRVRTVDVYDLAALRLADYSGLLVDSSCDQRFLAERGASLAEWVRSGGRIVANGHPVKRWLAGMPAHRTLEFHTPADLWLHPLAEHQIWTGVDRRDLLFRTGVPGTHSFARLQEIGVAGFYAHAYLAELPEQATVITGIGPGRLPVDVAWPLGEGEVVLHIGNDLSGFATPGTTTEHLAEQVLTYLEGR
ncbi:MAG TPA: hypothetical protein VFC72_06600 [Corynebacterium sp.]|nr:hypothetical protein [Corynebacterium sp.]